MFDRCTKCPFYYYEKGWEDINEGCEIKGWHFDEGLCVNMFLPVWFLRLRHKLRDYALDRKYKKDEKRMIKKCGKCKYRNSDCNLDECELKQ